MAHTNASRSYLKNRAAMMAIGNELDAAELTLSEADERAAVLLALAKQGARKYWPWSQCLLQARREIADLRTESCSAVIAGSPELERAESRASAPGLGA